MKRILLAVLALTMFVIPKAYAVNNYGIIVPDSKIDGIYYYKHRNDTESVKYEYHNFHEGAYIYKTSERGEIAYCIESWEPLSGATKENYSEEVSNISPDKLKRISYLAYFGYGYKDDTYDHRDPKWYALTQLLIWQITNPEYEHYLVDSITSTTSITNNYGRELSELQSLVGKEMRLPNITNTPKSVFTGDKYVLKDSLGLLDKFTVSSTSNLSTKNVSSSEIEINASGNVVDSKVVLTKTYDKYSHKYKTLSSNSFQDFMVVGNIEPEKKEINIPVIEGKITVQTSYNDYEIGGVFPNIEVKLYDENNNLIDTKITDIKGKTEFTNLKKGTYIVKYQNKEEEGFIPVSNQKTTITDTLYNNIVNGSYIPQMLTIIINKNMETNNKNVYLKGANVEFELYNDKDELIGLLKTNEKGTITKTYRTKYGNYYLIETKTYDGYELLKDKIEFNFTKLGSTDNRTYTFDIINNKVKEEITTIPKDEIPKDEISKDEIPKDKEEIKEEIITPIEMETQDVIMPDTSLDHINVSVPPTLSNSFTSTILLISLLLCLSFLCLKRLFYLH